MSETNTPPAADALGPPIPVSVARALAESHDCRVVILVGWRAGVTHVVTYGSDAEAKVWAAQGGETVSAALQLGKAGRTNEDFRLRSQAQWAVERELLLDTVRDLLATIKPGGRDLSWSRAHGLVRAADRGALEALAFDAADSPDRYVVNGQTATGYWRVDEAANVAANGTLGAAVALVAGDERLAARVCETMNLWHRCGELAKAAAREGGA